jgi:transposase
MHPRIDLNLGIKEEPDAWIHSACLLCSSGCGVDIAVNDAAIVGWAALPRTPTPLAGRCGRHGQPWQPREQGCAQRHQIQRRPFTLPAACSPDLNPFEQVFAKLKHMIRKAQTRDVEATWRKVDQLLDLFAPPSGPTISSIQDMVPSKGVRLYATILWGFAS